MNNEQQAELIKDFILESHEGLDGVDRDLLGWENGHNGPESIHHIFRAIHTIKGTSGCLSLAPIEHLAHAGENLLSLVRDGKIKPHAAIISILLALSDQLRVMLHQLEKTGHPGQHDHSALIARLHELAQPPSATETAMPLPSAAPAFGLFADEPESKTPPVSLATGPLPVLDEEPDVVKHGLTSSALADNAIRVDVGQLDKLMNLVGELVLSRNQILQFQSSSKDGTQQQACQRLNLITSELQQSVMKLRMQPIGNIWAKFPRIVRDLSLELHKKVRLQMEGNQTELDRSIIEAIKDPLTHLIRNAVDHGLELPANRLQQGKPETGTLHLHAYHEGGQVNIVISDDGAGINLERVRQKCLQNGLVAPEVLARMQDREIQSLIFLPGFSTAETVTNVSGRGVGMDVVKTNIEKIGGTVELHSEQGSGTTIKIKIPLTLAIIHAMIVSCGGERFAIPQGSMLELVRLQDEETKNAIEFVQHSPVYRLRGKLLPLVDLRQNLRLAGVRDYATESQITIVVLQAEDRPFGLVVDRIEHTEEIVVKPLGQHLKTLSAYAGATIMGDGKVALILDVFGVARQASILTEEQHVLLADKETKQEKASAGSGTRQTLLLFGLGRDRQLAVPLQSVDRLEEFSPEMVEHFGTSEVVQYRNEIMPLVRLSRLLKSEEVETAADATLHVIVYSWQQQSIGLVVDRILDIVEHGEALKPCANRRGIVGSSVVKKKVTEFLDIQSIVESAEIPLFSPIHNN